MPMPLPKLGPGFSPHRVVVTESGVGVDARRAKAEYGARVDVVFLRADGWTLGAPKHLERVAYDMWKDRWTHFVRRPHSVWVPIDKYGGSIRP